MLSVHLLTPGAAGRGGSGGRGGDGDGGARSRSVGLLLNERVDVHAGRILTLIARQDGGVGAESNIGTLSRQAGQQSIRGIEFARRIKRSIHYTKPSHCLRS